MVPFSGSQQFNPIWDCLKDVAINVILWDDFACDLYSSWITRLMDIMFNPKQKVVAGESSANGKISSQPMEEVIKPSNSM